MSEIEKAFEAGFRAYRDAFDHYDDSDETVEHSLKWRMAQYVAAQQSVQADGASWRCPQCNYLNPPQSPAHCHYCGQPRR